MTAKEARPRSRTLTRTLLLVCLVGPMLAAAPGPASGQAPAKGVDGRTVTVVLRGEPSDVNTYVPPLTGGQGSAEPGVVGSATFQPTYTGVPAAAQTAFQRALDIWGAGLNSTVPIRVVANWASLPAGNLGFATYSTTTFAGAPVSNTFYPRALADSIAGTDLHPSQPDMSIDFSNSASWYFGTGAPPAGTFDFTSVALHEIGHGLGFAGSMRVTSGQGAWGSGTPPLPDIYDRFTTDAMRRSLINTSVYPNPSTALGTALTSGNVFFDSTSTNAADGTGRPKLHAPATWSGASYSHLDEATYGPGDPNSLMTPSINQTEVVLSPGPLTLCILKALGWSTSQTCPPAGSGATGTTSITPTGLETGQTFTASATGVGTPNTEYRLRLGTASATCNSAGIVVGGPVVSSASRNIAAQQRTVPNNATTGGRWFCWVSADDSADHTTPLQVTIF